jgi:CheY-like chemotaxis protein
VKPRILVVDDDDGVRVAVAHILRAAGYRIALACDGKEAMDVFEKFDPSLLITDIVMPNQDGMETIREIKKHHPHIKIIAMSGGARMENSDLFQRALDSGADHTISKPFEFRQLTELIQFSLQPAA